MSVIGIHSNSTASVDPSVGFFPAFAIPHDFLMLNALAI
jgi:hypothetical protein